LNSILSFYRRKGIALVSFYGRKGIALVALADFLQYCSNHYWCDQLLSQGAVA